MDPLVSIIIPVYNAEKYLADTLTSAINQTWPDKEIIVIDDGSTDNSLAIIETFEDKGVKVYTQANKGASAARNLGLKMAKGDYIQFLDADDLLSTDKIEAQLNELTGYPGYLGLCGIVYFKDGTSPDAQTVKHEWTAKGSNDPADFIVNLYGGSLIGPEYGGMIQPNSWLTPRAVIDKAGFWNEELTLDDDGEFFCRVILASKGIAYSSRGINYYRKYAANNQNLSAKKDHQNLKSALLSNRLKIDHVLAVRDDSQARLALSRYAWETCFNSYPRFMDLAKPAEKKAKELAPQFKYNPYNRGITKVLSDLLGWKTVRYLQYLKHK